MEAYEARVREEVARYRTVENVHDLPFIFHHWSNRYVLPKLQEVAGVDTITGFFAAPVVARCQAGSPSRPVRVVSLQVGNGDLELQVAQCVVASATAGSLHSPALELNAEMQHRARAAARGPGSKTCSSSSRRTSTPGSPPSPATCLHATIPSTTCSRSSTCSRR